MVQRRVRRRRLMRRLRLATMVVVGVAVVGGAAFGIDRMVVALHRYYGSHSHSPSTTVLTIAKPATTTTAPGPPACASVQLSAYVYDWESSAGTTYETVSVSNISGTACSFLGYPALGASDYDGTSLPAPTDDVATLGGATTATSASAVLTMAPGARAWFELDYPDVCYQVLEPGQTAAAGATDVCYDGETLEVTPPRTSSPLLVHEPLRFTYGTAGFDVGPLVAGTPPPSPPLGP